jgi:cell wall-associated NlpC family hydrolase
VADLLNFQRTGLGRTIALLALCLGLLPTAAANLKTGDQNLPPVRAQLVRTALSHVGARYQMGGNGQGRFDCSGLVQAVYKSIGQTLPRTAKEMLRNGERIRYQDAREGDLLVYDWGSRGGSGLHVMIYLGGDLAVHASPSAHKVEVTSVAGHQWRSHFVAVARMLPDGRPAN